MGFRDVMLSAFVAALSVDTMRIKGPESMKGEDQTIVDLASDSIDSKRFPAVSAYLNLHHKGAWARFFNAVGEVFGQMRGYDAELEHDAQGTGDGTRSLVLASMARCWRPSPKQVDMYSVPEVLEEMLQSLNHEFASQQKSESGSISTNEFRPVHMASPIKAFGPFQGNMPHHHIISFTHEGGTSRCLDFDYGANDGPDPAGCRFFKKSFEPIQRLSRCVMGEIEDDPYRKMWEVFDRNANKPLKDLLKEMLNPFSQADSEKIKSEVTLDIVEKELKAWSQCQKGVRKQCEGMDTFKRTMELLKRVEFKDWHNLTYDQLHETMKRSILQTKSIPPKSALPSLSDTTVSSIIEKCFEFSSPQVSLQTGESFTNITGHDRQAWWTYSPGYFYKETLKCLPLIWDAVEVPRAPFQMLWFNTGQRKVENDFKGVHPLCGRLALAPLAIEWREHRTKYAESLAGALGASWQTDFRGATCFNREHATCKTLAECWLFLMRTHMPDISEYCAGRQPGPFDITDEIQTDEFKQSGFSCCCDKEKWNFTRIDSYDKYHPCKISRRETCEGSMMDYSNNFEGKCYVSEAGLEFYVAHHNPPGYCRGVSHSHGLAISRNINGSFAIPAAGLGEFRDARCLDGSMGKVKCLYSTPNFGRWGTVQCGGKDAGWCPPEYTEWNEVPDIDAATIGETLTPDCYGHYRREPLHAKTTCGSVNGYLVTSCVYDPPPDFAY